MYSVYSCCVARDTDLSRLVSISDFSTISTRSLTRLRQRVTNTLQLALSNHHHRSTTRSFVRQDDMQKRITVSSSSLHRHASENGAITVVEGNRDSKLLQLRRAQEEFAHCNLCQRSSATVCCHCSPSRHREQLSVQNVGALCHSLQPP